MWDISKWDIFQLKSKNFPFGYCITRKLIHGVIGLCLEFFDEFFFKIEKNQNFFNFRTKRTFSTRIEELFYQFGQK